MCVCTSFCRLLTRARDIVADIRWLLSRSGIIRFIFLDGRDGGGLDGRDGGGGGGGAAAGVLLLNDRVHDGVELGC